MRTPLAILNLAHGKWRTIVSTSGVSLAIILIFMQLGFLGAVTGTAVQIYDQLQFDVLLRSPDYFHFCDAREIPRSYLYRVASMPEVASVKPLHVTLATWRIPENTETSEQGTVGELRGIVAMGMEPSANVFNLDDVRQQVWKLHNSDDLLIDRKTKGDDYGAADGLAFGDQDLGREVEVWDKRFRIVGHFELGAGLAANGSVLMSSSGYARFFPGDVENNVNFGLVQLKEGIRPREFCQHLKKRLFDPAASDVNAPSVARGVAVLTRQEVRRLEIRHWLWNTPIGSIFLAGVAAGIRGRFGRGLHGAVQRCGQPPEGICHVESHGIHGRISPPRRDAASPGHGPTGIRRVARLCGALVSSGRPCRQHSHGDDLVDPRLRADPVRGHVLRLGRGDAEQAEQGTASGLVLTTASGA